MRKLILISVIALPLILAIRFSTDTKPQRGLRKTVMGTLIFLICWALLGPTLFFLFPGN